jgi:DNA-binding NarL/FixJ family response regulator
MKTIIISDDHDLINIIKYLNLIPENQLSIYSDKGDALEIMSYVCTTHPSLLIIDDDFIKPQSAQIIKAIRKVNQKINIIFITSNSSIELGREVSQLRIHYYAIKPLDESELGDSIKSIIKLESKTIY